MATGGAGLARLPVAAGAVLLALATVAGAIGAHALPHGWSAQQAHIYTIAVRYQFYQALGLLAMGAWLSTRKYDELTAAKRKVLRRCRGATHTLLAGIVLFSGSLYALSLQAPRWVGFLTPLGGAMMIGAWAVFAVGVWRS